MLMHEKTFVIPILSHDVASGVCNAMLTYLVTSCNNIHKNNKSFMFSLKNVISK